MDIGFWLKVALLVLAIGYWLVMVGPQILLGRTRSRGDWVAEAWLEWEICRGSTLYRQRFKTKFFATLNAKYFARVLDQRLPKYYPGEDYFFKWRLYRHEYAIHYGVRKLAPDNPRDGQPIWSPYMPGSKLDRGEHSMAHPVYGVRSHGE